MKNLKKIIQILNIHLNTDKDDKAVGKFQVVGDVNEPNNRTDRKN